MKIYVIRMSKIKKALSLILVSAVLFAAFSLIAFAAEYIKSESTALASAEEKVGRVIVIDAGHGGEDPGAIGVNGAYEKDLNLAVATALGEELISKGYTVVYTRTTDKMLYSEEENVKGFRKLSDLKNRCKIANEYQNAIFVSIHMNSYGASKYSGLQVYYAEDSDSSRNLATMIQDRVKTDIQNDNNRAVKEGKNMYVLENCKCDAVLIECGFLTNEVECNKLSEKEYQKELSFSISCSIIEYIEETSKTKSKAQEL